MSALQQTLLMTQGRTTQTFNASTNWIAPSNVSSIYSITGKGADGVARSTSMNWISNLYAPSMYLWNSSPSYDYLFGNLVSNDITFSEYTAYVSSFLSALNSGGTGERNVSLPSVRYDVDPNRVSKSTEYNNTGSSFINLTVIGGPFTVSDTTFYNYNTSATFTPSDSTLLRDIVTMASGVGGGMQGRQQLYSPSNVEVVSLATMGNSSSAFNITFPGGNAVPATPSTYNNISVTPNSSYVITVPVGGSITIVY